MKENKKNRSEIEIWQNINEITFEKMALKKQIKIHQETLTIHNDDNIMYKEIITNQLK